MSTANTGKISGKESLEIVEKMRQDRLSSVKNFFAGMAKAVTTDLPGFLMDVADKFAGDTATLGEKDRSAQLFETMTGIKTKSGSGGIDELVGGMINPIAGAKAVIVPAMVAGKTFKQVKQAQELLNQGVDVSTVFEKTDIYPGLTDDILRSVISDTGAKLKYGEKLIQKSLGHFGNESIGPTQRLGLGMWENRTLGDILDHPELFSRIPELKDIPVSAQFGGWDSGAYSPETNRIFMGGTDNENEFKSILLHEVQHAIQNKYGMTQGGNSGMFYDNEQLFTKARDVLDNVDRSQYDSRLSGYNSKVITDTIKNAKKALSNASNKAFRNYENLGGEAEARAVQKLLETPQLAGKVPLDYYPVDSLADIIASPSSVPKVDSDPVIKAILDFVARNPEFGKTKP